MDRQTPISSPVFAISRRARRAVGGSLAGAALLAAGLGCTGWSAESCDQYLLCVSATMPLAQTEQLALYGKDGSCWSQIEPEQCARACKAGLKALAQTSTAKECHPTTNQTPDEQTMDPMMMTPFSWPLPSKAGFYTGPTEDPLLTGEDPISGDWRCTRDDKNQSPPAEIARMAEPNELPQNALVLPNPLMVDPPSSFQGSSFEICPDRSAPTVSDFDVFKFKLNTPAKVIAEITYQVKYGDLDISLFRDDSLTGTQPVLVAGNLTGKDNACIERDLAIGTYYLVVYGARDPVMQTKTAMNRYKLRVFEVQTSGYTCS
jgi:hypothetical protein